MRIYRPSLQNKISSPRMWIKFITATVKAYHIYNIVSREKETESRQSAYKMLRRYVNH
jgi:hypothetical protein